MPLLEAQAREAQAQYDEARDQAEGELVALASLRNNVDAEQASQGATDEQGDGGGAKGAEWQPGLAELLEPGGRGFRGGADGAFGSGYG